MLALVITGWFFSYDRSDITSSAGSSSPSGLRVFITLLLYTFHTGFMLTSSSKPWQSENCKREVPQMSSQITIDKFAEGWFSWVFFNTLCVPSAKSFHTLPMDWNGGGGGSGSDWLESNIQVKVPSWSCIFLGLLATALVWDWSRELTPSHTYTATVQESSIGYLETGVGYLMNI